MKLRLVELELHDFKGLNKGPHIVTFNDMLFLSGPNGFGKTTIFEAIELCLTGKVARIEENIRKEHGRVSHDASPLHNNGKSPFQIKLRLRKDKDERTIEISKQPGRKPLADYNKDMSIKFYGAASSENNEVGRQTISDWLGFGTSPEDIFKLFVYMSQEDNTFFLKQKQTDRHTLLNPLLDTDSHNGNLEKIEKYCENIATKISELEKTLKAFNNNSLDGAEIIEYQSLFPWMKSDNLPIYDSKEPYANMADDETLENRHENNNTGLKEMHDLISVFDLDEYRRSIKFNYFLRPFSIVDNFSSKLISSLLSRSPYLKNLRNNKKIIDALRDRHLATKIMARKLLTKESLSIYKEGYTDFTTYHSYLYEYDDGELVMIPAERVLEFMATSHDVDELYKKKAKTLWDSYSTMKLAAQEYGRMLQQLDKARSELTKHLSALKKKQPDYGHVCIYCGHDWKTDDALLAAIEGSANKFATLENTESKKMKLILEKVVKDLIQPMQDKIGGSRRKHDMYRFFVIDHAITNEDSSLVQIAEQLYPQVVQKHTLKSDTDISSIANEAKDLEKELRELISMEELNLLAKVEGYLNDNPGCNSYTEALSKFSFELPDTSNVRSVVTLEESAGALETNIKRFVAANFKYNKEIITNANVNLLGIYFDLQHLDDATLNQQLTYVKGHVDDKIRYVNGRYRLEKMKTYKDALRTREKLIKCQKQAREQLLDKYRNVLTAYQNAIMRDLQLPFYIYSARILQNCSYGSGGLFIRTRGEKRRSLGQNADTSKTLIFGVPGSTHDVTNQLSSGQLVAVALAFFLSMNTIYPNSTKKLLLLDDPVQDMDSLNFHAFIDLMRREYVNNNYQVILSTHDDLQMNYMRYKFRVGKNGVFNVQNEFFKSGDEQ